MRVVLAKMATEQMARQDAMASAQWSIHYLEDKVDGPGGIIVLDRHGQVGYAFNTPRMAFAYMQADLPQPVMGI